MARPISTAPPPVSPRRSSWRWHPRVGFLSNLLPDRTARPDFLAGLVGVGFSLSGFLRRFRLCLSTGLIFGNFFFAILSYFVEL